MNKMSVSLRKISKYLRVDKPAWDEDNFWKLQYEEFRDEHFKIIKEYHRFLLDLTFLLDYKIRNPILVKVCKNPDDFIKFVYDNIKIKMDKANTTTEESEELSRVKEFYYKQLIEAENKIDELIPKAKRGEKMTGKKLTNEDKIIFLDILSIQKELEKEFGRGHKSSLTKAIWIYNNRNKKHWDKNDIHSKQVSIGYHQGKGNLPK